MQNKLKLNGLLILFFLSWMHITFAQDPIQYHVKLDNIRHHELEISITFPSLSEQALTVRMPTASPGRYAEHNFAKNVFDVHAFNAAGKELRVVKTDIDQWEVSGHEGFVKFQYTLFGNRADGTYTGIDNRKVHLNMPATFAYGKEMEERPVELTFDLKDHPDWSVATQLKSLSKEKYWAPNYYYFFDSPTIVGDIDFRQWQSSSDGKEYTIELALLHEGTDKELDDYTEWVKKVVEEQKAIYGTLPEFDFGKYTFLCSYNPWVKGDGMEHRNSTICSSSGNLKENAAGLIGTISHEFFHCWNVERIRPKSLEPFNFDEANMSDELWFAEGFTSYYTGLTLCRAGIRSPEKYINSLTGTINYVTNAPGSLFRNPIEMSRHAPFVDAATSVDPTSFSNTFISYYSYGSFLGLALDLSIRSQFENKSLDDLMKYMWEHFGQPEIPYQIRDIQKGLATISGDPAFAKSFFDQYIYDSQMPDIQSLLKKFGVDVSLKNPNQAHATSLQFEFSEEGAKLKSNILKSMPIYQAGVNQGDLLLTINGEQITDEERLKNKFQIGKTYTLTYLQNGKKETGSFTTQQDPTKQIALNEDADERALERRKGWLASKME